MWQWSILVLVSSPFVLATAVQSDPGVECIIFNDEYMTCMWNSQGKPAVNYSLYYWYENDKSSAVECRRYLQEGGINNGCWFSSTELIKYRTFEILLNGSLGAEKVVPFTQEMRLQNRVKLNPPVNLTIVSMNNNQLLLTWESSYKKNCVEFKVKYASNKETMYTEIQVNKQFQFSHPSVDPEKFYTFYVSAKVSDTCATTDLWSEWSLPIYWGKNTTREPEGHWNSSSEGIIIYLFCSILIIIILAGILRMERIWVIIVPRIPNPSKNFEELFNTHNGNFSEWTGVSKDVVESFTPNFNETICYVSEAPLHKSARQPAEEDGKMASSTIPRTKSGQKYIFSSAPTSIENLCPENYHQQELNKDRYVKV